MPHSSVHGAMGRCPCDVTALCDEGCECDIACGVESPSGVTQSYASFGEQTSRSESLSLDVEISAGATVGAVGFDVTVGVSAGWTPVVGYTVERR